MALAQERLRLQRKSRKLSEKMWDSRKTLNSADVECQQQATISRVMNQKKSLTDDCSFKGLVDAAIEIAQRRRETLRRLRQALETSEDAEALNVARELCGMENEQESHRTDTRIN
jgi:hypothetical protein